MGLIKFIRDMIVYPFDKNKKNNRFSMFLDAMLKNYPSILWIKPNIKKALIAPFIVIYYIFKKN